MKVQGRLISRDRVIKETNQNVTFYSIHALNKDGQGYWAQVNFDKAVDMKKIEVPGLVEIEVFSAKIKTTTADDGTTYKNKIFYANSCSNVESLPEFEAFEQELLEAKING